MISSKPHTTISAVMLINTASQNLSIVRPLCLFANETSLSHRKFLDLDKREEEPRLDGLKPGRHVHAEHHDRDDLERVRGAPGRTNLGTLDVRDIDRDAGIRIVFLGIDGAYCELRVFVQELREPLDLLLRSQIVMEPVSTSYACAGVDMSKNSVAKQRADFMTLSLSAELPYRIDQR